MRAIDVISPAGQVGTVLSAAEKHCADHWVDAVAENGRQTVHLLVDAEHSQKVLDRLQSFLGSTPKARIVVSTVEATLPAVEEKEPESKSRSNGITSSREELLGEMAKRSRLDSNFMILVFLSTVVAAVLSITTGLSSVLVGVMVAVALMPPAVTLGLMLSSGHFSLAVGALLLLLANIVCLNFAANCVYYAKVSAPGPCTRKSRRGRPSSFRSLFGPCC